MFSPGSKRERGTRDAAGLLMPGALRARQRDKINPKATKSRPLTPSFRILSQSLALWSCAGWTHFWHAEVEPEVGKKKCFQRGIPSAQFLLRLRDEEKLPIMATCVPRRAAVCARAVCCALWSVVKWSPRRFGRQTRCRHRTVGALREGASKEQGRSSDVSAVWPRTLFMHPIKVWVHFQGTLARAHDNACSVKRPGGVSRMPL